VRPEGVGVGIGIGVGTGVGDARMHSLPWPTTPICTTTHIACSTLREHAYSAVPPFNHRTLVVAVPLLLGCDHTALELNKRNRAAGVLRPLHAAPSHVVPWVQRFISNLVVTKSQQAGDWGDPFLREGDKCDLYVCSFAISPLPRDAAPRWAYHFSMVIHTVGAQDETWL
jgi:hypothetical protein